MRRFWCSLLLGMDGLPIVSGLYVGVLGNRCSRYVLAAEHWMVHGNRWIFCRVHRSNVRYWTAIKSLMRCVFFFNFFSLIAQGLRNFCEISTINQRTGWAYTWWSCGRWAICLRRCTLLFAPHQCNSGYAEHCRYTKITLINKCFNLPFF